MFCNTIIASLLSFSSVVRETKGFRLKGARLGLSSQSAADLALKMLSSLRSITDSSSTRLKLNSQRRLRRRSNSETQLSSSLFSSSMSEGLEAGDLSSNVSSQENLYNQKIRENVDKLGRLADKCEQVNSNLEKVVAESHKILDNSFLASQTHLTDHVSNLNYGACLDIVTAMDTYSEYVEAVEDLVEAEGDICVNMLQRLEKMDSKAQLIFLKAKGSKYHLWGDSDSEDTDDDDY